MLLVRVPLGVVTWTGPVVAPLGTVVVISELETTVNVAAAPLKVTRVVPVKLVPRMVILSPTLPEVGRGSMKGPSPTERLNTVPEQLGGQ